MIENRSYLGSRMDDLLPAEGELITDLDMLVERMVDISRAAPEVDLPHIQYGMYGYAEVTKQVTQWVKEDRFDDSAKMASTMPDFAERSFKALRYHVRGEPEKVGAWSYMFYSPFARKAPPGIAMGDFLSTHVYDDLPKTLLSTNTLPEHQHDYSVKINSVLRSVGKHLLPQYVKVHPAFERLRVPNRGLNVVLNELFDARDVAWNAFVEMKASQALYDGVEESIDWPVAFKEISGREPRHIRQIEKGTEEMARRKLMSSRKVSGFMISHLATFPKEVWAL